MKKYELHPTMEYPTGQELSPSQKLVEKVVEVLALNPDDSWDRNRMEQVVAFWLRIGRSTAKFGVSCAIQDGFIQDTSGICEPLGVVDLEEGKELLEAGLDNSEIISELSEL